ncbi:MAG: hypothetical protein M1308_07010 [Actinobacteria bacterium]|nr:hypothetical protein [Actinomycetota bacterium]
MSNVVKDPDIEKLSEYYIMHLAVDRIPVSINKSDFKSLYVKLFEKNYL